MAAAIHITADEINHLIHAYLQDSGFEHSAFVLKHEGHLENSDHFNDHIPRGELVELMTKALLYLEVETHWRGDSMITECKAPFSLLQKHECSSDLNAFTNVREMQEVTQENIFHLANVQKRKADTPASTDGRSDKRVRRETESDIVDDQSSNLLEAQKERDSSVQYGVDDDDDYSPSPAASANGEPARRKSQGGRSKSASRSADPRAVRRLLGHSAEVFVCAWNPTRPNLLATGSKDATVRIWDLGGTEETEPIVLQHLPYSEQRDVTSLDWNGDGTLIATGSYDSILRVWTASGEHYMSHPQHQGPIFATRFSKSGQWLLTSSLDGTACVWDVAEKKLYMQFRCHDECCLDVDWLNEDTFVSCGADRLIQVMQLGRAQPLRTLDGHLHEINQIKFNSMKTRLASCSDDKTARIWNMSKILRTSESDSIPGLGNVSGQSVLILEGHTDSIGGISWLPNTPSGEPEVLATSAFDGGVRLWNADTGECLHMISDHTRATYSITFSPEGKFLVTGSGDGWLYVYNVETKQRVWSWYAGTNKPGIYEIEWQKVGEMNRMALCLECKEVGLVDVTKISALS